MDFSPADLFRSTKTGSRSSLDRVNKQLSASRGTFRQKVHIGVLVATVALVAYGAIIIWSASQFKADASFSRHLLGIGIGTVLAVLVWRSDLRGISNFSTALLVIDLIVIFSPKIPGLSYTGGLGMTGWIKIPGIGLTFQPVELAKLITIFFIATLGSQYNGRIDTVRDYVKLCGMLSIPFLAVVAMGDLEPGTLSVLLYAQATTNTLTLTGKWQVSLKGTTADTWYDAMTVNDAANVLLVTGTGSAVNSTRFVEAPDSVYGYRFARYVLVTGGTTASTGDEYSMSYQYMRPFA